jgi:polyisoprenoid-binding protein YceI
VVKSIVRLMITGMFVASLGGPSRAQSHTWLVDSGHSDALFSADGTTNYGKTNTTFTIGSARVSGLLNLNKADVANSRLAFTIYPAVSASPLIDQDGKFVGSEISEVADYTVITFVSNSVAWAHDGKLQVKGQLTVTRIEREMELDPNEAYAGPVFGPPIVRRYTHETSFALTLKDLRISGVSKRGKIQVSASGDVSREDFPELLDAAVETNWPPVVQDENCQMPSTIGEDYAGASCTGALVEVPDLPEPPHADNDEDYPGPADFNYVVGRNLTVLVHMDLSEADGTPLASEQIPVRAK